MAEAYKDKVVVVTGGSRGLGEAMSRGFAAQGAKVVVASRKLENCQKLVEEITSYGGEALAVAVNTGDTDDLDRLIETVLAAYECVDIVIINAGINVAYASLSDCRVSQFDKMFNVNLKGPWYLASRLAPHMAKTGGGCVVNILSVAGLKQSTMNGFYGASKAGLKAMTETMAIEWAEHGIRVNAIAPGSYRSDLVGSTIDTIPGFEEGMISANLIPRIAESEEILKPVFYLCSDNYVTGTTLIADGGLMVK